VRTRGRLEGNTELLSSLLFPSQRSCPPPPCNQLTHRPPPAPPNPLLRAHTVGRIVGRDRRRRGAFSLKPLGQRCVCVGGGGATSGNSKILPFPRPNPGARGVCVAGGGGTLLAGNSYPSPDPVRDPHPPPLLFESFSRGAVFPWRYWKRYCSRSPKPPSLVRSPWIKNGTRGTKLSPLCRPRPGGPCAPPPAGVQYLSSGSGELGVVGAARVAHRRAAKVTTTGSAAVARASFGEAKLSHSFTPPPPTTTTHVPHLFSAPGPMGSPDSRFV
jgi:hypothetical protein